MVDSKYLSTHFKLKYLFKLTEDEISSEMLRMSTTGYDKARDRDWKDYIEGWRKVARPLIVFSILTMTFSAGYLVAMFR